MLKHWKEERPPINTWIMACYGVMDELQPVKSCKSGCCVFSPSSGNLMLPSLWRLATEDEVKQIEAIPPMPQINLSELYES